MRNTIQGGPGLWSVPTSPVAPGALKQASGVVIRDAGVIEQSRPLRLYPGLGGAFAFYRNRFIGKSLTFSTYRVETGLHTATMGNIGSDVTPTATLDLMRTAEANGNLYVSCAQGWLRLDSLTSSMRRAGVARALDAQLTLVGAGTLLANTQSIAYRILFGFKDANSNLVFGAPSGRSVTTATAAQNVSVKALIPTTISAASNATSYFVQVYGTAVNTVASTDPGEDMQLKYQAFLTAADVAAGFTTFVDATPDSLRGAAGYFVPSQEGIAQSNYRPPLAHDIALYAGSMFYANTTQQHRSSLQMTGVSANLLTISTAAGGITKSGGNGVYTFTGTPDLTNIPTDGTAKLSATGCTSAANNGEFVITAVNTGAFTITVTNAGAVTEPGLAGSRGWPSKLTIAGVNYYGSINGTETAASQVFKVSTAGTASQNVTDTCSSLIRVVNQQAVPVVYGYYESGPDDGAGKMSFSGVSLGGSSFNIAASGTLLYNSFNPTIPVAAPITSNNDAAANRLYISKEGQPEHVPLASYFDIGARTKSILRIIALRGALLVFKEDGIFRVTGEGGVFSVSPHDPYATASSETSVVQCINRVYAFCPMGIYEVTDTYSRQIHGPVADLLRGVNEQIEVSPALSSANVYSWATELDSTIGFSVQDVSNVGSGYLTLLYCSKTGTWSTLPDDFTTYSPASAFANAPYAYGQNSFSVNGLSYRNSAIGFMGDDVYMPVDAAITSVALALKPLPGHKIPLTVSSSSASSVTFDNLNYSFTIPVGTLIVGGNGRVSTVTGVSGGGGFTVLALTPALNSPFNALPSGGIVYLVVPQNTTVEWHAFTAGDDGTYARFSEASPLLDGRSSMTTCTLNLYTEATASTQVVNMTATNTPLPSGVGTQTLVRSIVPASMQHARRMSVVFNHNTAGEYLFIRGVSYEFERLDGNELT